MLSRAIHQGMNRREAYAVCRELGGDVRLLRRTGMFMMSHPLLPRRVRGNARKKSVSREAVCFLREVRARVNEAVAC